MNGKVAKKIRRMFKDKLYDEHGNYVRESDMRIMKEVEKPVHIFDEKTKQIKMVMVKRYMLVNANKYKYRLLKKAYNRKISKA